jgi:hypothetical protein
MSAAIAAPIVSIRWTTRLGSLYNARTAELAPYEGPVTEFRSFGEHEVNDDRTFAAHGRTVTKSTGSPLVDHRGWFVVSRSPMTAPAVASATTDGRETAVRRLEGRLRNAAERLGGAVSATDVRIAHEAIDNAERALGDLVLDPWEPSLMTLRQAREILSIHLLAAAACEGAEVAPPVTARVLRQGADSARRVLAHR